MAEESSEFKDVLTRKVGPLPVAAWGAIAAVIWYYFSKKNKAASQTAGAQVPANAQGTQGTDPAGNTGYIDPQTGYVYGSAEDIAALNAQSGAIGGTGSSGGSSGTSGTSSTSTYTTNQDWEVAAINYLVGLGVDPVDANAAIAAYLNGGTLSVTQQAQVNEAILALGSPPQPPSPSGGGSITNPPGGGATTYATNPPTGLTVSSITANSAQLKWNAATNATGYSVSYKTSTGTASTITSSTTTTTIGNLTPSTSYQVSVQGTPADTGAGSATASFTTASGIQGGNPPKGGGPTPAKTTTVTVVKFTTPNPPWNSYLSGIAAHYNTTTTAIMKLNPAITNPNLIYPGQKIIVPVSS